MKYLSFLLIVFISTGCTKDIVIDEVNYSELQTRMTDFPENRLCSWIYDASPVEKNKYYFKYLCSPDVRPGGSMLYLITGVKIDQSLIEIKEHVHLGAPIKQSDIIRK